MKIKAGIINVTGYAGSELARILHNHKNVEIVEVTGRSQAGNHISQVFPHLADIDLQIEKSITKKCDVIFSGLPHAASAEQIKTYFNDELKILDLSADFRLNNLEEYTKWYDTEHPSPEKLKDFVYGLTEIYRNEIKNSNYVAVPGCFPTSTLLACFLEICRIIGIVHGVPSSNV